MAILLCGITYTYNAINITPWYGILFKHFVIGTCKHLFRELYEMKNKDNELWYWNFSHKTLACFCRHQNENLKKEANKEEALKWIEGNFRLGRSEAGCSISFFILKQHSSCNTIFPCSCCSLITIIKMNRARIKSLICFFIIFVSFCFPDGVANKGKRK